MQVGRNGAHNGGRAVSFGQRLLLHARRAARAAAGRAGGRVDVEELAAELLASALARFAENGNRRPEPDEITAELDRAAARVLKAKQRRRKTETKTITLPARDVSGTPAGRTEPPPETHLIRSEEQRERRSRLAKFLWSLPRAQRRTFYFARLQEPPLSDRELRRRIGIGRRAANAFIAKVLRRIKADNMNGTG